MATGILSILTKLPMPVINHRRPNTQRTCLGGRCCEQCGFVCHRHWISNNLPQGIRAGESAMQAWGRQHVGTPHPFAPESIRNPSLVVARGTRRIVADATFAYTVEPPRITGTGRRNNSYDTVQRGRRAPHAAPQPGDPLITDEEIMEALRPVDPF